MREFDGGRHAAVWLAGRETGYHVASRPFRSFQFRDLIRHVLGREQRLTNAARPTRFLAGGASDLNRFIKLSRFKEIRAEILIVQPGISVATRTPDQNMVLAAALTDLSENQLGWLATRPNDMQAFLDQFVDIFDFAGGIANLANYKRPPKDALEFFGLLHFSFKEQPQL